MSDAIEQPGPDQTNPDQASPTLADVQPDQPDQATAPEAPVYAFRATYKASDNLYIEDAGYARTVEPGDADFAIVASQFGPMLAPGQTALPGPDGWEIVEGCPLLEMQEERNFKALRAGRDARLAATDYMLMPDYPLAEDRRAGLLAYRQALRDLPGQAGAPWDGGGELTPWPALAG